MRSAADEEAANDGQVWSAKNPPNETRTSDTPANSQARRNIGIRSVRPSDIFFPCSDPVIPSAVEESLASPSSIND